ncbi:MAG TPA: hypothetical protein VK698_39720 [Kofleriaceae bacterium]|nr:hypothetical protein [Kofleriaceae bacterium]
MPPFLWFILPAELIYCAACVYFGARYGAPLWLRWPHLLWARMLGTVPPEVGRVRPDYPKIRRLERELGISDERPAL